MAEQYRKGDLVNGKEVLYMHQLRFYFYQNRGLWSMPWLWQKMVREATPDEIEELNNREKEEE